MKVPTFVKFIGWFVFIVTLLSVFIMLFGEDIREQKKLNDQLAAELERNAKLQEELDAIKKRQAQLQNPEYLEYLARQRGLVYPEEKVYIFKESNK
ncbi:MAG: septum formation initiator family protein [Kiritimatiellae bacterium]|nr:septum formation initiator family protein [Kiritimatiellia bacterium]